MRPTRNSVDFYRELAEKPHRFDFFPALRHIECLHPTMPRIGSALRPADEPVRLGQNAELIFAPTTISAFEFPQAGGAPRMAVRFMGLLGPNGALPLHLTEYIRERELHEGDKTLTRFLDLLHHRVLTLFYRAWAQAQPVVNLDRPRQDRFAIYVGANFGLGTERVRARPLAPAHAPAENAGCGQVSDFAKLFFSGHLVRQVRNREGLAATLAAYFRVPVRIEEFVGHWLSLPDSERTRLGDASAALGAGAVLGGRVWDRQHKIRVHLGPLSLQQYESFLPGGIAIGRLLVWLRQYLCFELQWDARLLLAADQVPKTQLGRTGHLGWTTWLGKRRSAQPAADLCLDPERLLREP